MKSLYNFVISPEGERYDNKKSVGDKELILNTEIFNHEFVNRKAKVKAVPTAFNTDINIGDDVIVHHNIFRRWYDIKGNERNSRSFIDEDNYLAALDQIFLYKKNNKWICPKGYCFVKPLKNTEKLSIESQKPLMGVIEYSDGSFVRGDLIGFRPGSEYEFVIEGQLLYRVLSSLITIKYEYQGDEEAYNPSWA